MMKNETIEDSIDTKEHLEINDVEIYDFGDKKIDDTENILKELQEINQNITIWNEEADQNHNKIESLQNVMNPPQIFSSDFTTIKMIIDSCGGRTGSV